MLSETCTTVRDQLHSRPLGLYLFAQVSADNSKEAHRHTMLRSRQWWEAKFAAAGAEVNHDMLWAMQHKNLKCAAWHFTMCTAVIGCRGS